jgi:hypothetical protein
MTGHPKRKSRAQVASRTRLKIVCKVSGSFTMPAAPDAVKVVQRARVSLRALYDFTS